MNKNVNATLWLGIAVKLAEASTCRVKVGCVLVQRHEYVGGGYVGSVSGDAHCCDSECLLVDNHGIKGSSDSGKSCIRTVHAEMNAVHRCKVRGTDSDPIPAYCTHQPCLECMKSLLSIGVRRIVYIHPYRDVYRDLYVQSLSRQSRLRLMIARHMGEV